MMFDIQRDEMVMRCCYFAVPFFPPNGKKYFAAAKKQQKAAKNTFAVAKSCNFLAASVGAFYVNT